MTLVSVDRWKAKDVYLVRAEQYAEKMRQSLADQAFEAAAGTAVHCVIAAMDAFCILASGKRYKGLNHKDAVDYFRKQRESDEHRKTATLAAEALSKKTDVEYGDRLTTETEAESMVRKAERTLAYVKAAFL